jgi:hypothetical protein
VSPRVSWLCDALLPNAPCGLNPSSPIILFKAAAIASRSFFWLLPKLRRGRRPVVVGGKVRWLSSQIRKRIWREARRFALYKILYNCRPLSVARDASSQATNNERVLPPIGMSMARRFGGLHRTLDRRSSGGRTLARWPVIPARRQDGDVDSEGVSFRRESSSGF